MSVNGPADMAFVQTYLETGSLSAALKARQAPDMVAAAKAAADSRYVDSGNPDMQAIALLKPGNAAESFAKLTPSERAFVREFVVDRHAGRAAQRIGVSADFAKSSGAHLIKLPHIKQAIIDYEYHMADRQIASADDVLTELSAIALSDIRDLFDEHNRLKTPAQMSTRTAKAVKALKVNVRRTGEIDESGNPIMDYIHELTFWDKPAALDKLAKYYGLTNRVILETPDVKVEQKRIEVRQALLGVLGEMARPVPRTLDENGDDA